MLLSVLLALRGEAATARGGLIHDLPIDLPDIIGGRTPGGLGIDQSAYEVAADRYVTFNFNVTGLGDSAASVYLLCWGDGQDEYDWALTGLRDPASLHSAPAYAIADGKVSFQEQMGGEEFAALNNFYAEIFIDADNHMFARLGEDPNFSVKLDHIDYETDYHTSEQVPVKYYYNVGVTVDYENGYIAPFHEGPDPLPTPEPTSGLLMLVGSAFILLRRRK